MPPKRILLSVGDDSGDLHAANLMREVRRLEPDVRFVGLGMERTAAEGLEPLEVTHRRGSEMWMLNILHLGHFGRRMRLCCEAMADGVDLVLPVDFGGFNLCLCRRAARFGAPVFYYILPQVWAHGRYRMKKLRRWLTRAGLIYPFEVDLYREWKVPADYVGHPLFDEIERRPPSPRTMQQLHARFGASLVGIFPGSRRQEVRANLPVVAEVCRRIRSRVPDAAFAAVTTPRMRPLAEQILGPHSPLELLDDVRPTELAGASRVCITKSGTITLEIASHGTPMVIYYRVPPFGWFLARGLGDVPWIGLINVLAGRTICAEKLAWRDDPDWLADRTLRLLTDPAAHAQCRADMAAALEGFARPGASAAAARIVVEMLKQGKAHHNDTTSTT
jgi:lipid-A-disaccharide synthase